MIFLYPEFKRITLEKALSEYLNIKKGLKPQTKQFYLETVSRYLHDWKERMFNLHIMRCRASGGKE